jgi:CRP-like cAMP-binding protein
MIKHDYYGNRSIVAEIGPSEMFCDEFACADVSSVPVSFISNEPSEIMLIECQRVLRSCGSSCNHHHRMIFNLMKNLADKNIRFHERIEITSKRTTREKLMAYLIAEAQRIKSTKFEIPFDRQELADYLEVDRSGLSSEIGKLVKEGIIAANKRQFELL